MLLFLGVYLVRLLFLHLLLFCLLLYSQFQYWWEIPPGFEFYIVTRSYSSLPFLCTLGFHRDAYTLACTPISPLSCQCQAKDQLVTARHWAIPHLALICLYPHTMAILSHEGSDYVHIYITFPVSLHPCSDHRGQVTGGYFSCQTCSVLLKTVHAQTLIATLPIEPFVQHFLILECQLVVAIM